MTRIEDKSGPVVLYRLVSHLTLIILLIMPILAGQFIADSREDTMRDIHAGLGQLLHITVFVQMVLAFLARRTFGIGLSVFNLVILVLVTIQAILGFEGSENNRDMLKYHVPLGTFLLLFGAMAVLLSFFDLRRQRRITDVPS